MPVPWEALIPFGAYTGWVTGTIIESLISRLVSLDT